MYDIFPRSSFKKDFKRCKKRGYNISLFKKAIDELAKNGKLQAKYKAHKLLGNYKNRWECHIKPDWLLIWEQDEETKTVYLDRTGTHNDLF